jgi:hypothetical protein
MEILSVNSVLCYEMIVECLQCLLIMDDGPVDY